MTVDNAARIGAKAVDNTLKVTLVRSGIGKDKRTRQTLKGLGLTRLNKTMTLKNTPAVRGMIEKVSFMVRVEG